jgi:hypothetical protein
VPGATPPRTIPVRNEPAKPEAKPEGAPAPAAPAPKASTGATNSTSISAGPKPVADGTPVISAPERSTTAAAHKPAAPAGGQVSN